MAPIGYTPVLIEDVPLGERFSITALTSASGEEPVLLDYREGSNTAEDFLAFLVWLLQNNKIPRGHVLVVDNATVHVA